MSRPQAKMLENSSSYVIGEVNRRQLTLTRYPSRPRQSSQPRYNSQPRHGSACLLQPQQNRQTNKETCTRCGQVHRFRCPAAGIKFKICNKFNHFAVMCRFNKSVKVVTQEVLQSNESSSTLDGLGCIRDFEVNLTLKPDAKPSIDACRRVPLQLQKPLKDELASLEKSGVIQRVEEPTEWILQKTP